MSVDRAPIWDHPDLLVDPLAHRLPNRFFGLPDPPMPPPPEPIPAALRGPNWTPED
ncbi:hypothetical protein [Streptomyces corynorhini]|uniref:hypothetical protein n=1 Tax=Streptomyces corynorhini TaxID=2282652 RepID=UPI0013144399|nr:hypothetical protein [Streptomyces corynorhini]